MINGHVYGNVYELDDACAGSLEPANIVASMAKTIHETYVSLRYCVLSFNT